MGVIEDLAPIGDRGGDRHSDRSSSHWQRFTIFNKVLDLLLNRIFEQIVSRNPGQSTQSRQR